MSKFDILKKFALIWTETKIFLVIPQASQSPFLHTLTDVWDIQRGYDIAASGSHFAICPHAGLPVFMETILKSPTSEFS